MTINLKLLQQGWDNIQSMSPKLWQGILVAHSGGPDSTALFEALCQIRQINPIFNLGITHVNYGLRGQESDLDEAFSRHLAQKAQVPIFVKKCNLLPNSKGIQEQARKIRYDYWQTLSQQGWVIALAHHLDDIAETVIFRLARGSSIFNLAGMKPWTPPYWRPFLDYQKSDLLQWLEIHGHPFRKDASNDKLEYARNVIRHQILPVLDNLFPGANQRIAQCALEGAATMSHVSNNRYDLPPKKLMARMELASFIKRSCPDQLRPLSRKWLDSAHQTITDSSANQGLITPKPTHKNLKFVSIPGGGFLVAKDRKVTGVLSSLNLDAKFDRAVQHRHHLCSPPIKVLLPPQGQTWVAGSLEYIAISNPAMQRSQWVDLTPIDNHGQYLFGGLAENSAQPGQNNLRKKWRAKELWKHFSVELTDRIYWKTVQINGVTIGLWDGKHFVRPPLLKAMICYENNGNGFTSSPLETDSDVKDRMLPYLKSCKLFDPFPN